MKFGLHYQISCSLDQAPAVRYRESLEQAVYAESLGFESIWPVEQHFNQRVSVLPAPLLFLSAVAARTSRIRLGTAITILPLHHPVRVAEELATLDVLSGGRVEFGFGRGSVPAHFARFGVAIEESRSRMLEALQITEGLLAGQTVSFTGAHFNLHETRLVPCPVQTPFPAPRAAANSLETFEQMGQLGYPIFAASYINPFFRLDDMIAAYRNAFNAAGHGADKTCSVDLLCPVFVADSLPEVASIVQPSIDNFRQIALDEVAPLLNQHSISILQQRVDYLKGLSFEQLNRDCAIFGTPGQCIDRIKALKQRFNVDRLICWFDLGGLVSHDAIMKSMKMFADEVMPAFTD